MNMTDSDCHQRYRTLT